MLLCFSKYLGVRDFGQKRVLQRSAYCRGAYKGPSTKDVRQMGRGGGFEISDVPGRGEGGGGWFVKVRTSENF